MKDNILNQRKLNFSLMNNIYLLILHFISVEVIAKDFGINGNIYKIIEEPFVQMIENRAQKVDVEKLKAKMQKIAKDRIANPKPKRGIKPAIKTKSFYHDPSYILDEDVVLPCGKRLYKSGTSLNPLEHMDLERRIIFIDARRIEEVKWLTEKLKEVDGEVKRISTTIEAAIDSFKDQPQIQNKIVLVAGSPSKLQEDLDIEIYFDQQGSLTTKWGIKHSPAIVIQSGKLLKITEYKVERNFKYKR